MSQRNLECVRKIYDAVARRDGESPFEVYADDIVWDMTHARYAPLLAELVYRGHEGVRRFWRDSLTVFSGIELRVEDLLAAGDDVLAAVREDEVGRGSGVPVTNLHYAVWTFADGKAVRLRVFDDLDEARAAAGLS